jgi:hypothetical protein
LLVPAILPHDFQVTEAPECLPVHDALMAIPGVLQAEAGWRYPDGWWRVGFDLEASLQGWTALQFIAWAATNPDGDGVVQAVLTVEASFPPTPGRDRTAESLTFCIICSEEPGQMAGRLRNRLSKPAA